MTIAQQSEEIITHIMEHPSILKRIQDGMTVKDAIRAEAEAHMSFYQKTDRSTEKGRQLDDICIKHTFNYILSQSV